MQGYGLPQTTLSEPNGPCWTVNRFSNVPEELVMTERAPARLQSPGPVFEPLLAHSVITRLSLAENPLALTMMTCPVRSPLDWLKRIRGRLGKVVGVVVDVVDDEVDWVDDDEGGRTTTGEPPPQAAKNPDMAMTSATATRSARERITRDKSRGDGVRSIATTVLKRSTLHTMEGVAGPFQGPKARMLVSCCFSATYGPSFLCVLDVGGDDRRAARRTPLAPVEGRRLRCQHVGFSAIAHRGRRWADARPDEHTTFTPPRSRCDNRRRSS